MAKDDHLNFNPLDPDVVAKRVDDSARAEKVRKSLLGYRQQIQKAMEGLADSKKSDSEIVDLERQLTSLLMILDKLEKRKRITADTMLDFTSQMRQLGGMLAPGTGGGKSSPAKPSKGKVEEEREVKEGRKWMEDQFAHLSESIGENVDTFIKKNAALISTGSQTSLKAALFSVLGPGAPVFAALDDMLGISKMMVGLPGKAGKAAKSLLGMPVTAFKKLMETTTEKAAKTSSTHVVEAVEGSGSKLADRWHDLMASFKERWKSDDTKESMQAKAMGKMSSLFKKGMGGLKGLGGGSSLMAMAPIIGMVGGALGGLLLKGLYDNKDKIAAFFSDAFSAVFKKLGDLLNSITDGVKNLYDGAKKKAGEVIDDVKNGVKQAVTDAKDGAKKAFEKARNMGSRGRLDGNTQRRFSRVRDPLLQAALAEGVDPKLMTQMAYIESGFNHEAQPGINPKTGKRYSSAKGLMQLTDGAWKTRGGSAGKHFDPLENAKAGAREIKSNTRALVKMLGREPTDGEQYLTYFLGAGAKGKSGMSAFISGLSKNPDAPAAKGMPSAASANPPVFYHDPKKNGTSKPKSYREIYQWAHDRMSQGLVYADQMPEGPKKAPMQSVQPAAPTPAQPNLPSAAPPQASNTTYGGSSSIPSTPLTADNVPMMPDDTGLLFMNLNNLLRWT